MNGKHDTGTCIGYALENLTQLHSREGIETRRGFVKENLLGETSCLVICNDDGDAQPNT